MPEYLTPIDKVLDALDGPHGDNATLYARTRELVEAAEFPTAEQFANGTMATLLETCAEEGVPFPHESIVAQFAGAAGGLYVAETLTRLPPDPAQFGTHADNVALGKIRDLLIQLCAKARDPQDTLVHLTLPFLESFMALARALPPVAHMREPGQQTKTGQTVGVLELFADPGALVEEMIEAFTTPEVLERCLFRWLHAKLDVNVARLTESSRLKHPPRPSEFRGAPNEIITAFLDDTPLKDIFLEPRVPLSIPDDIRLEHTLILGGSGAGKTTLIQQLVLDDLDRDDPPPIVLIDPKGQLVARIQQLDLFDPDAGRLKDRLVTVDPSDPNPPALNMFHVPDAARRHPDLEAQAVSNFAYIFSTIDSPLTQKQGVCFSFCVRLLFRHEGATIETLMELLSDPAKEPAQSRFHPTVQRLDDTSRRFFLSDFYSSAFGETRQQIKTRLYSILVHPQLLAMLSAPERTLDLFECLQQRKIVLVNASLGAPGSESSQLFARYVVALTLNAAFQRATIPDRAGWHPAHLIIDEFQLVADQLKTPEMLRLAREYGLGVTMAFQEMHGKPFDDALRASLSTNTSVKYASSPEGVDIGYAARDLRTDADFIRAQTKTRDHARFACFVRGWLDRPVSISVPFGNIQARPRMSADAHRRLLAENRARLAPKQASAHPSPPTSPPPPPDAKSTIRRW